MSLLFLLLSAQIFLELSTAEPGVIGLPPILVKAFYRVRGEEIEGLSVVPLVTGFAVEEDAPI